VSLSSLCSLSVVALLAVAPPPDDDDPAWAVPSTGQAAPAIFELHTPRFRIRHTARAQGAARALAGQLEQVRDEVAAALGRDWPGITEVRLGFGREEYEALAVDGVRPPGWAVALAWPERNVVLVEAHSLIQGDGQQTLRHELVHVALGQLGHGWPHWWQEGLAMAVTHERSYRLGQYATLARAVALDRVYRLEDLSAAFPADPDGVEVAYAESAAFVEFLQARHPPAAFGALLDRVQAGDPFERAFGVAFHTSLSVEEKVFRAELPLRYPWWPVLLSGGTLVWGAAAALLVLASLKRRRQVAALRTEQARVERLEDLGAALLARRDRTANEDLDWAFWPVEGPWVLHVTRVLAPAGAKQGPTRRPWSTSR
jgi:Peptidase MA superfamily